AGRAAGDWLREQPQKRTRTPAPRRPGGQTENGFMNSHLQRGRLLFQQSRYDLAEAELRQALAEDPNDAYAHALLAMCLAEREEFPDATAEARQAIHLEPDSPFTHYVLAQVLHDRHHNAEALA